MEISKTETFTCEHCGADADITLEGFDGVEDVIKRKEQAVCKACGQEIDTESIAKETYVCDQCGAEADITLEGFDGVEDVIKREKGLSCKTCGKAVPWTDREDIKAIRVAMKAERDAFQTYLKAAKQSKNPKGKDMFQQLSDFELNHFKKLKALLKSLREKGEWIVYEGTNLKEKRIPLKTEEPKDQDQLTDMDALKMATREEKKAQVYYRSMAELTKDLRGKEMYKRLANEEELHEKLLNDQFYSLHNKGIWSWGD